MSMILCDHCKSAIDTDEHPDAHESESDQWICWPCRDREVESHYAEYCAAPLSERNPAQYRQDMRDAGRGHLLPESWEE